MTVKLSQQQRTEIINLYASQEHTTEQIALRYGVSPRTIQRIAQDGGVVRTVAQSNLAMAKLKRYRRKDPDERAGARRKIVPAKIRYKMLTDHPYCCMCGRGIKQGVWLDIDHIDNDNSNNDPTNLQVLCHDCNVGKYWHSVED